MGDAARMLDDLDRPVEHNVEGEAAVPFREEDVACLDVADAARRDGADRSGRRSDVETRFLVRTASWSLLGGAGARPATRRGLGQGLPPVIANMSSSQAS